ncbi:MAG TPA: HAD family hydrolase [Dehalococcoidia bacterium]|nr:HAD family hydrolase [Dehalococcoidia bacterium]
MTVRAVCFDLDGTLLSDEPLDEAILQASRELAAHQPQIEPAQLASINRQVFLAGWRETEHAFIHGTISGDEISRRVWRMALSALGFNDAALTEIAFGVFSREVTAGYRLCDDALPILDALGPRMPLALITNGASDVQRRKLVATGIESRFAAVLVSGELGTPKPMASIFLRAAELLGVEPANILHVGDSLEADVGGAMGAGMTAVWLNRDGRKRTACDPEPHHEIASLSELAQLLERPA